VLCTAATWGHTGFRTPRMTGSSGRKWPVPFQVMKENGRSPSLGPRQGFRGSPATRHALQTSALPHAGSTHRCVKWGVTRRPSTTGARGTECGGIEPACTSSDTRVPCSHIHLALRSLKQESTSPSTNQESGIRDAESPCVPVTCSGQARGVGPWGPVLSREVMIRSRTFSQRLRELVRESACLQPKISFASEKPAGWF